jgi:hypothetical protein
MYLSNIGPGWYFVAYDHSKSGEQAVKIYSLARVHQMTASDKTYYQDPGFNAQEYFKYSIASGIATV